MEATSRKRDFLSKPIATIECWKKVVFDIIWIASLLNYYWINFLKFTFTGECMWCPKNTLIATQISCSRERNAFLIAIFLMLFKNIARIGLTIKPSRNTQHLRLSHLCIWETILLAGSDLYQMRCAKSICMRMITDSMKSERDKRKIKSVFDSKNVYFFSRLIFIEIKKLEWWFPQHF